MLRTLLGKILWLTGAIVALALKEKVKVLCSLEVKFSWTISKLFNQKLNSCRKDIKIRIKINLNKSV